jgi:hypothetical protein
MAQRPDKPYIVYYYGIRTHSAGTAGIFHRCGKILIKWG